MSGFFAPCGALRPVLCCRARMSAWVKTLISGSDTSEFPTFQHAVPVGMRSWKTGKKICLPFSYTIEISSMADTTSKSLFQFFVRFTHKRLFSQNFPIVQCTIGTAQVLDFKQENPVIHSGFPIFQLFQCKVTLLETHIARLFWQVQNFRIPTPLRTNTRQARLNT